MKDTIGHNRHDGPEEPENSSNRPTVSYSAQQRRMYLEGLRAWARVAVRSYANRHGAPVKPSVMPGDGGETDQGRIVPLKRTS